VRCSDAGHQPRRDANRVEKPNTRILRGNSTTVRNQGSSTQVQITTLDREHGVVLRQGARLRRGNTASVAWTLSKAAQQVEDGHRHQLRTMEPVTTARQNGSGYVRAERSNYRIHCMDTGAASGTMTSVLEP